MKARKLWTLILTMLLLTGVLFGCGSKSEDFIRPEGQNVQIEENFYDGAESPEEAPEQTNTTFYPDQKLIKTVSIYAETENLDEFLKDLGKKITGLNGYVESEEIYNGSENSQRNRDLSMTIRIPAENLDAFLSRVSENSNVVSQNISTEDVTLTYADTQARIDALETEQNRLLELMEKAETTADLLEIEARLADVRYELESFASQMKVLENKISYSTVQMQVSEVARYTPIEKENFWQRVSGNFMDSLNGLGNGLVEFSIFVLGYFPYILVIGGVIAAIIVIAVKCGGKNKKKPKKTE